MRKITTFLAIVAFAALISCGGGSDPVNPTSGMPNPKVYLAGKAAANKSPSMKTATGTTVTTDIE